MLREAEDVSSGRPEASGTEPSYKGKTDAWMTGRKAQMELRQIRYFLVLAEERSFSRAAKRVYISQPSLSRQIGALESELGFSLFLRGGKELELTGAGKELLPPAKDLESSMEVFRNEAERIRTKGPEILRIGYEKETEFLIPRIVRAFSERFPEGHLELSIQKSDELTRSLCRREISAAIRYFTPEKEDNAVLP
ncbi:MAG: LysR family transcriptional regulator, partial [Eubacteriales bacterium]|nr:LysR family transcriptional regulator [Eubacteriales bacterium]